MSHFDHVFWCRFFLLLLFAAVFLCTISPASAVSDKEKEAKREDNEKQDFKPDGNNDVELGTINV